MNIRRFSWIFVWCRFLAMNKKKNSHFLKLWLQTISSSFNGDGKYSFKYEMVNANKISHFYFGWHVTHFNFHLNTTCIANNEMRIWMVSKSNTYTHKNLHQRYKNAVYFSIISTINFRYSFSLRFSRFFFHFMRMWFFSISFEIVYILLRGWNFFFMSTLSRKSFFFIKLFAELLTPILCCDVKEMENNFEFSSRREREQKSW